MHICSLKSRKGHLTGFIHFENALEVVTKLGYDPDKVRRYIFSVLFLTKYFEETHLMAVNILILSVFLSYFSIRAEELLQYHNSLLLNVFILGTDLTTFLD